ncbi:DUF2259 domain-containing protein [Rhizobium sp. KVB221]|uniref:DUF2259 domain-containing protein n=1 Tax=Rhizobium setariae TaxID=2801340 RepID=A0A937CNP2_9HYPH|nr:DUF2259 domain-containing protein [Rhizobium setariae]MBL0371423.1 DUF2259 domain-containing protein [Rhizobium setariae]
MNFFTLSRLRIRAVALVLLVGASLAGTSAHAGDSAQLDVIGFSADGRIFAFEEFGVQDGSGFAYSNIYFLDTQEDKFLPGTPFKVLAAEEMTLGKIRKAARGKALPLIDKYDLENNPGLTVAYNPVSEAESNPHRLKFYRYPVSPPFGPAFTVELKPKLFPAPKTCLNMEGAFSGFSLSFTEPSKHLIYEDQQVPSSRYCPNGYRLGAVIASDVNSAPAMVMIQVSNFGFEGNDERWIAVPVRLTEQP